jgi:hypothetical protein
MTVLWTSFSHCTIWVGSIPWSAICSAVITSSAGTWTMIVAGRGVAERDREPVRREGRVAVDEHARAARQPLPPAGDLDGGVLALTVWPSAAPTSYRVTIGSHSISDGGPSDRVPQPLGNLMSASTADGGWHSNRASASSKPERGVVGGELDRHPMAGRTSTHSPRPSTLLTSHVLYGPDG